MNKRPSDKELIERMLAGDEHAFNQLYKRYDCKLYTFLRMNCSDERIIEEIFQDTWETVIKSAGQYKGHGNFKIWLFCLAKSRLVDYYRKPVNRSVDSEYEDNSLQLSDSNLDSTEVLAEYLSRIDLIFKILAYPDFPEKQAQALSLYLLGYSYSDIAEITEVKKETSKSRIRYAIARLIHYSRRR